MIKYLSIKNMKDLLKKMYPIILPPLCIVAGVLAIVFFFVGPVGKGQYDILAIGAISLAAAILQIVLILVDFFKNKKKKK